MVEQDTIMVEQLAYVGTSKEKKRLSESVSWAVHMRRINFKFVVQCMHTVDKLKLVVMYMYGGLF